MFGIIKKMFVVLLARLVNASNHTKYVSFSNQECELLINLHPNEYSEELLYYPFAVKLDKCVGSCNTFNDLSNKVCVPDKTEDLNIHVFNIITRKFFFFFYQGKKKSINILTNNISYECKCKLD